MKKIIAVVTAAMVAASAFAVDFTAQVKLKGDIAYGVGAGKANFFGFEDTDQKDDDLLTVAFSGEKAGADFRIWSKALSGNIQLRKLDLWFKPIDMLKITLGAEPSMGLYTEKLSFYKVPNAGYQGGGYKSNLLGGAGILVEADIPVMGGVYLGAGITPGFDVPFVSNGKGQAEITRAGYGVAAKVSLGVASVGLGWADTGRDQTKYIRVGADFGGGESAFYGMAQLIFNINDNNANDTNPADKYGMALRGLAIDNYFSYDFGAFKLDGRFPITIRGLVKYDDNAPENDVEAAAFDYSYMVAKVRVQVPMDSFTFGLVVGTDEGFGNSPADSGKPGHWQIFNKNFDDTISFYVNPYINFNVGACSLSLGTEFAYDNALNGAGKLYWAVPFSATVNF